LKFKEAILRFINSDENEYQAKDEVQQNAHSIFNACLKSVPKIRDGKPSLAAFYVSLVAHPTPRELEQARNEFKRQLEVLGYFSKIGSRLFACVKAPS